MPKEVAELAEKYQFILKDERSIQKEVCLVFLTYAFFASTILTVGD